MDTSDNLAWHDASIRASDFFIRADISAHGMPGRFEQLWVKRRADRLFEICSVPFFTYGIALGDTVETDEEFTFQRVAVKGGHKTLRVAVRNSEREGHLHRILHKWVANTGLPYEWYAAGYLAVDLPPGSEERIDTSLLDQLSSAGEIATETDDYGYGAARGQT